MERSNRHQVHASRAGHKISRMREEGFRDRYQTYRRVIQIPSLTRIKIEEDARHDDSLLLQQRRKEVQAVVDCIR